MDSSGTGRPFRPMLRQGTRFDPQAAGRPILVFEDVHKAYRSDAPVLRGLNLEIARGEFVFITGPRERGKSTLLRLLHAAESVDAGRILFLGREIGRLTSSSVPFLRRNIGIVFQDFKLVQNWSVVENVALLLEVLGLPAARDAAARGGSARASGLERPWRRARRATLRRRSSVWRSRAPSSAEPALLLALTSQRGNLDPQLALDILGLLEDINESGVTVLFATHDRSLLDALAAVRRRARRGRATDVPPRAPASSLKRPRS